MEKIKWYERSAGNTSSMRVALMMCVVTGITGFLFSLGMTIATFITQRWESIPIITTIIASSAGIMAVGDLAKGIQAKAEKG